MAIRYLMDIKRVIDLMAADADGMMVDGGIVYGRAVRMMVLAEYVSAQMRKEVFQTLKLGPGGGGKLNGTGLDLAEQIAASNKALRLKLTGREEAQIKESITDGAEDPDMFVFERVPDLRQHTPYIPDEGP